MKNESGYITALSIIMTLIILSVMVYNAKLLMSERLFLQAREVWFQTSLHLQSGRKDLISKVRYEEEINDGDFGTFIYPDGRVNYFTTKLSDAIYVFRLEVRLNKSGSAIGLLYYDYVKNEVVKWVVV
ncbi:competence type IV pilus minor pilin ComGG [Pseudalkalibacillus decolorationis]|uniref:competence type IV pilus minor pilin ComGG n=1 Tax=Pseudalkalibacillus decolorationis TaxID=163879 RepID=UPI002148D7CC|nr:competence type IV pilus minor pilin ComGG [Pseudalkalibacillus decolorationis]